MNPPPTSPSQANRNWRKTTQALMPSSRPPTPSGHYDLYPAFPLEPGLIELGFEALASRLEAHSQITIDGFIGVFWADFRERLKTVLDARGLRVAWHDVGRARRDPTEIEALVEPFLGGDDPLFGTRFTGSLKDFFDPARLEALKPDLNADLNVISGCGAALAGWEGLLVYVDLPKNEVQFRARAKSATNLGCPEPSEAKLMYKRFYFVDWPVLNAHKASLLERIDAMVDAQRPGEIALMSGADVRAGLGRMAQNFFRVRPWFEPGAWGGQRLKTLAPSLPQDAPNYAWSFELIAPENGLVFESNNLLLEVSFDWLMFFDHRAVLGEAAARFGFNFPIRFDYLDTIQGGKLSLQCHPRPAYARAHFGEPFTQDESYYILEAEPGASVYLGFQDDIDPLAFRRTLERSHEDTAPVEVERFVQRHPASPHDLFLIPSGTIHCSGAGALVLEISATPYIFTFKMYDWLRLDLDGQPRPLNIARAFENLALDRRGSSVREDLISKPCELERGDGWRIVHLPTHVEHFYDVRRLEFEGELTLETNDQCHVMSLVEGTGVSLETAHGMRQRFNYGETFVVPAAAGSYRLRNEGSSSVKVVQAFVKTAQRPDQSSGGPG